MLERIRDKDETACFLTDSKSQQSSCTSHLSNAQLRKIAVLICLCLSVLGVFILWPRTAEFVGMPSLPLFRSGCVYLNNDLQFADRTQSCAEPKKLPVKYQDKHFDTDGEIAFAPTDFDFSSEDFDYSRCAHLSAFRVFVPSVDHPLAKALAQHPSSTANPDNACVTIEFADGNVNPVYERRQNDSNLLVVNLNTSTTVTANGSVMLAQARFAPGKYRRGLDFAIHPSVEPFDIHGWKREPFLLPVTRQIFAAYITSTAQATEIAVNSTEIPTISCSDKECDIDLSIVQFCILSPSSMFQAHLLLSLQSGCIPVVMSLTQPLPFQDHLDWNLATIRFPRSSSGRVRKQLAELRKEDVLEMRRRGTVFRRRLDNAEALASSLLAAVADRLQLQLPTVPMSPTKPVFANYELRNWTEAERSEYKRIVSPFTQHGLSLGRMYSHARWNSGRDLAFTPRTLHDVYDLPSEAEYYEDSEIIRTAGSSNERTFGRGLGINREPEQFTVLLMTYHRDEGVKELIRVLDKCPHLNKVIIVWNNVGRDPVGEWPKIHVPVEFIRSARNSLNNRFLPYDRIETEAVFSIDDDMGISHEELVYAFRVWRQNRDRIVGFVDRFHSWIGDTSQYGIGIQPGPYGSCEYSMLLDSYFIAHKEFFYEYSYNMHAAIREHVDDVVNCGDIAFNYLVSHLTRKPPMKVQKIVGDRNKKTKVGLSGGADHFSKRNACIKKFNAIYGYNPLILSQMQAVPAMSGCIAGL